MADPSAAGVSGKAPSIDLNEVLRMYGVPEQRSTPADEGAHTQPRSPPRRRRSPGLGRRATAMLGQRQPLKSAGGSLVGEVLGGRLGMGLWRRGGPRGFGGTADCDTTKVTMRWMKSMTNSVVLCSCIDNLLLCKR